MPGSSAKPRRYRDLQKGADLSLENAFRLLEEADTLHRIGSYGHASTLAMHAIEEMGKAEICMLLKDRVKMVPNWRTAIKRKNPHLTLPHSNIRSHEDKYWHFLNFLKLGQAITSRIGPSKATSHALIPLMGTDRYYAAKRLDLARRAAIFVDYSEGKWTSPAEVTEERSTSMREFYAKAYASWVKQLVKRGWKRTVEPIRKEVAASTVERKPFIARLKEVP